jgi:hypothetical protein
VQERERLAIAVLPILGKPAAAIEPRESALDDPALWQDDKSVCLIGPPDDLDAQVRPNASDGSGEPCSLVSGIGEQRPQERIHSKQRRHDENAAVAILHIGRMNDGVEQQA